MDLVCLDMESVLVPEMWVEFAKMTGIDELAKTTREEPDYDKLMKARISALRENDIRISAMIDMCASLDPLPGARDFLDELRRCVQVIIVSDTFPEFAMPLMAKLGYPTLFCNELIVDDEGFFADYRLRCKHSKLDTVQGLQSIGFSTIAAGDSFNDTEMILASKAGFLFNASDEVRAAFPQINAFYEYSELLGAIKGVLD